MLDRNNQKEAYVRAIAWRGSEQLGVSAQQNKIHLAVATWEWPSYFAPAQRLVMAIINRTPDSFYRPGITWDEGAGSDDQVLTLMIRPKSTPQRSDRPYDHYSLLATIEDGLGLPRMGSAIGKTTKSCGFSLRSRVLYCSSTA